LVGERVNGSTEVVPVGEVSIEVRQKGTFSGPRANGCAGLPELTQLDLNVVLKSVIEAPLKGPGFLCGSSQGDKGHESEHQGSGKWNGRFQFAHGQN
jgi:hypothetical protein